MSADRPYQSHLLSFLNRQVQVAKDRTGVIWRTVKLGLSTALTIGIQGILYPFYAVLKAAELVGKQLGEAQEKAQFWLRSGLGTPEAPPETLASDSPLQNLLTALTQRQLAPTLVGDADELTMVLAAEMAIQGVASRLSDRRLVLITPTQQVLDVLSDSQALAIQKRISYEVALYLRWVRSRTIGPAKAKFLKFSNPLALKGKSELVKSEIPKSGIQASPVRIPTLWQDPANLTNLGFFSLPNLQDLPSLQELPSLIEAAFKYFFGRSGLGLTEAVPHAVRYQSSPMADPLADPWLTAPETLLGEWLETPSTRSTPSLSPPAKPVLTGTAQPKLTAAQPRLTAPKITLKRTKLSAQAQPLPQSRSSDLIENFDCNPIFTPDWLETEFEHLGYDRTWLDHCVAWLDEILVRIEKTFLTIWASFLRLFQSR
jgi:hypothetical protein